MRGASRESSEIGSPLALESFLIKLAKDQEVVKIITTEYGIKYVVDGKSVTPNGIEVALRTIWIIEKNKKEPHFVTAYPISGFGGTSDDS